MAEHDDRDDIPPPPPGYHAAIGAKGGRRRTPKQRAHWASRADAMRKLTDEQRAAIVAAYAGGQAAKSLAQQYGVTHQAIYSIIRAAGGQPHNPPRAIPQETREAAARAFLAGEGSAKEVAARFGMSITTLRKAAKERGKNETI